MPIILFIMDFLNDFSSIINMASQAISSSAGILGSTFSKSGTKELYDWSHERHQNWMLSDPTFAKQGYINAGYSPASMFGSGNLGGSSFVQPNQYHTDVNQGVGNFLSAMMNLDQLKTNKAERNLINAQTDKELSESALIQSQTEGQNINNQDYNNALTLFGGRLTSETYNNFINSTISANSIEVQKLSNDFRSSVLRGQINDPDIVSAVQNIPIYEQQKMFAEISKYFQDCLLSAEQISTERSKQSLNYSNSSYLKAQQDFLSGVQTDLTRSQIGFTDAQKDNILTATEAMKNTNPYDLSHAISDLNTSPLKKSFWRGAYNYILNGAFSVLGSGVQASASVHNTNTSNATKLETARINSNTSIQNNQLRLQIEQTRNNAMNRVRRRR